MSESGQSGSGTERMELQERDIHDLHLSDRTHLRQLNRRYGKERVIRWLKAKVALPTRLEAKKLDGENVDEDAYYRSLADHYIEAGTDRDGGD